MNLKRWTKLFLALIAILQMVTAVPVTYADDTQSQHNNQEFHATHAKLVNFLVYLKQTLSDFGDYDFNEELLENLHKEIELALTVTHQSTEIGTVEYSLGFLKRAFSSLLEDAIESEINATQLLLKELNQLTEESFTSHLWVALQEQIESTATAVEDILQELDELGFILIDDSDENKKQDLSLEVLVIELPDLTSNLREIFDKIVEIRQQLESSQCDILATSTQARYRPDETEVHESVSHSENETIDKVNNNSELKEQDVKHCPPDDNEFRALLLQVARYELLNHLINYNISHVEPLTFKNATQILVGDDLGQILITLNHVLDSLES